MNVCLFDVRKRVKWIMFVLSCKLLQRCHLNVYAAIYQNVIAAFMMCAINLNRSDHACSSSGVHLSSKTGWITWINCGPINWKTVSKIEIISKAQLLSPINQLLECRTEFTLMLKLYLTNVNWYILSNINYQ